MSDGRLSWDNWDDDAVTGATLSGRNAVSLDKDKAHPRGSLTERYMVTGINGEQLAVAAHSGIPALGVDPDGDCQLIQVDRSGCVRLSDADVDRIAQRMADLVEAAARIRQAMADPGTGRPKGQP